MEEFQNVSADENLRLSSKIVAAYAGNHKLKADEIPALLHSVYSAVEAAAAGDGPTNREPAVPVNKSVTPQHLICLEDGKKLRMLKRYLMTHYKMTPEEYRRKWGLPANYPMTAPGYSKKRSQLAKDSGLGRTKTTKRKRPARKKRRKAA